MMANPGGEGAEHSMGMGLSIYRSTINAHDGRLFVVPNNRRGAEFRFVLGRSERRMQNLAKFQRMAALVIVACCNA
jgi:K+-sensing histidine kinase KdpD